jgi:hypothetical protein
MLVSNPGCIHLLESDLAGEISKVMEHVSVQSCPEYTFTERQHSIKKY